jgi:hypothetical protein
MAHHAQNVGLAADFIECIFHGLASNGKCAVFWSPGRIPEFECTVQRSRGGSLSQIWGAL